MTPYRRCLLLKYSVPGSIKRTQIISPERSSTTSANTNSSNDVIKILTKDSRKKASIIDVRMSDLECILDERIAIGLHKYFIIVYDCNCTILW